MVNEGEFATLLAEARQADNEVRMARNAVTDATNRANDADTIAKNKWEAVYKEFRSIVNESSGARSTKLSDLLKRD